MICEIFTMCENNNRMIWATFSYSPENAKKALSIIEYFNRLVSESFFVRIIDNNKVYKFDNVYTFMRKNLIAILENN